ncbi:heavy metal translocating P-type ATPase [Blautia sp. An81]|uniref:heavy metal translocating P-type ATPase n=1 Tax=Blautia sp. An81 TaxID=1965659 RepID=UPI000B37CD41|nr:heavy metal translocating P-type ATPase [Blautia sp. An81]OUN32019.1 copper-translocating P-type ATPase [Blautia sp. An81]
MKEKFDVTGMTCSACSSRVEKCVSKLEGVNEVSVNLLTNSMQVEFNDAVIQEQGIIDAVVHAGYGASVRGKKKASDTRESLKENKKNPVQEHMEYMKKRTIWSFIFLIPLMYVSMGHMIGLPLPGFLHGTLNAVGFAMTQFLLCIPVIYINRAYYTKGFSTLLHGAPNMDTLIAVGSAASLVYGVFAIYRMGYGLGVQDMDLVNRYLHDLYFESAVMILALINIGKYLEARSKGKTSEAINKLMDMAPKTAFAERNGTVVEIPAEEIQIGDILQVKPGSSVPADGVVLEGVTSIDEAAITGESIPVQKVPGDSVIAATMNKAGFFRMKASKVGDDTTFSQIIRLVEDASASKAPIAKIADKIAGVFVPIVMTIALITAAVWLLAGAEFEFALSCAISVLVISCPCALGLATPVAIMVGTGKGAENGILIKSGEALEVTHNIQSVVLDKTGTITQGKPAVTDIHGVKTDSKELLKIAAAMEKKSEHPLAEAVLAKAEEEKISLPEALEFSAVAGMGIEAVIEGKKYYAGNLRLMKEKGIDCTGIKDYLETLTGEGKTPLLFADEKELLGVVGAADIVKPTSAQAIRELKKMGIQVIMLTGDNERTAKAIQRQLDIDTVIAEVLPQDKEREVAKLQENGQKVAMVGDGINDAPALARADVGIAIGAGTDVAIESADIVLMKNDLLDVVTAISLSKAVIRNIKENLFWAFFYNVCGIPLAAGVFYTALGLKLSPMFGAAAMSLSSLFVVSNALRLRFFHVLKKPQKEEDGIVQTTEKINGQTGKKQIVNTSAEAVENKEEMNMYTMKIEGMMCPHCQAAVTKALNGIEGVKAEVDLEKKEAYVEAADSVSKEELTKAVVDAGYEVVSVE